MMKTTLFYLVVLLIPVSGLKADIIAYLDQLDSDQIKKHAFVLIDVEGDGNSADGRPDIHENIRQALVKSFDMGIFIVNVNYRPPNKRVHNKIFHNKTFQLDMTGINTTPVSILPQYMKVEGRYLRFRKPDSSVFSNKSFEGIMREKGIDTLILSGVFTHWCVHKTAIDALERQFYIVFPLETVSSAPSKSTYDWLKKIHLTHISLDPRIEENELKRLDTAKFLQVADELRALSTERLTVVCTPSRNDTFSARKPDDDDPDDSTLSAGMGACGISY